MFSFLFSTEKESKAAKPNGRSKGKVEKGGKPVVEKWEVVIVMDLGDTSRSRDWGGLRGGLGGFGFSFFQDG